ncbi:MAG: hypothetical protein H8K04_08830 [Nitrospira sp.]
MHHIDVAGLEALHTKCILETLAAGGFPEHAFTIEIKNEIKPVDLYAYLHARFGPPNGAQNLFRHDDSDNLIHWDWTLSEKRGVITFLGLNFRTEILFFGDFQPVDFDKDSLIETLKADFQNYGKQISEVRKNLEEWVEFVNPFQRTRSAIEQLTNELEALNLSAEENFDFDLLDPEASHAKWKEVSTKYSRGFGLCFGIRAMLPILAEAFVNLLFFLLCRADIKADKRLYDNVLRQPIDVRIKTLHINCTGFIKAVDYASEVCGKYHSIVNERNDLLHGNVTIDKLSFGEVFFNGTVPVFSQYKSMWERSFGVGLKAAGLWRIKEEHQAVIQVIDFILSCVKPEIRDYIQRLLECHELGFRPETGRLGLLFSNRFADFRMKFEKGLQAKDDARTELHD